MQPPDPITPFTLVLDYERASAQYHRVKAEWSAALDALERAELRLVHLLKTNALRDLIHGETLYELVYCQGPEPTIGTRPVASVWSDLKVPERFPRPLNLEPADIIRDTPTRIDLVA